MNNSEPPIVYGGTDIGVARRKAPQSVIDQCRKLKCNVCGKRVLAVK